MQAPYPILEKAAPIPLWQKSDMAEEQSLFDIEILKEEAKRQGFTQKDLATVAGITSQSAISNIFNGKRHLKVQEANAMYRFLGLQVPKPEPLVQMVPVIGMASAGNWREAIRDARGSYPIQRGSVGERAFAVIIDGDSLDLVPISAGTVVIVDPDQRQLFDKSIYLIRNGDGELTAKQYRSDPARFEPCSSNPAHKTLPIGEDQFTIIGKCVHTVGNLP